MAKNVINLKNVIELLQAALKREFYSEFFLKYARSAF